MFDFRDIQSTTKSEQIRAWAVEQAIDILRGEPVAERGVVSLSRKIEDFVLNGVPEDKTNGTDNG